MNELVDSTVYFLGCKISQNRYIFLYSFVSVKWIEAKDYWCFYIYICLLLQQMRRLPVQQHIAQRSMGPVVRGTVMAKIVQKIVLDAVEWYFILYYFFKCDHSILEINISLYASNKYPYTLKYESFMLYISIGREFLYAN